MIIISIDTGNCYNYSLLSLVSTTQKIIPGEITSVKITKIAHTTIRTNFEVCNFLQIDEFHSFIFVYHLIFTQAICYFA